MSGKKSVMLVVNPISGGKEKSAVINAVEEFSKGEKCELSIYETSGNNDSQQILDLFKMQKPSRVIVAGGDGTIKLVAETLEQESVILGIIPAGSANGLSVDLDLPTDLSEQVKIAFSDKFQELDMICINDKKSLHLSDIGLNAELIRNYENSKIRGKLGYVLQSVNTITDDPVDFNAVIESEGGRLETPAKIIIIANSKKYGTGVTVNPNGDMGDGKFEIIVFKNLDLLIFSKVVAGNILDSEDVEIITTDKAKITTDIPVHFQIDGEYCDLVTTLNITIAHRQMKVAVP